MAGSQHWTFVGLSFLLLAMTELTAPASSYHLRGEENRSDSGSPYSQAIEQDIGSTLDLLSYLLAERDDVFQRGDKHSSAPSGERKDMSKIAPEPIVLEALSSLSQDPNRQNVLLALLQRLQLKSLLKSVGDDGGEEGEADDESDSRAGTEMVGFESFLNRAPATSSAAVGAKTDDVIPAAAIKSKRGRHGHYGAMPPTNELCRMMGVRCY